MTSMTELSIIIPTFNSMQRKKNSLELVLDSIEKQTLDKKEVEIIFVDNGSIDDTISFISTWIKLHEVDFGNLELKINPKPLNRSEGRNIGVEASHGEQILFIDDDTVIYSEDTLRNLLLKHYRNNSFFCGASRYWTFADWNYEWVKQALANNQEIDTYTILPKGISRETGRRDLQEFSFIGNFGGMMKKDFIKVGGFDSNRFPGRQEDVELMFRLLLNNFSFELLNEIKVIHLTHPIIGNKINERNYWLEEFRKKEWEEGYYFCVNHLFGVYEDNEDTHPVLKRII